MSFDTGAVDADILHVRIQRQIPDDLLKDSRFLPLYEALIHSLPGIISVSAAPLRMIQQIPLSIFRESSGGRPLEFSFASVI